MLDQLTLFSCFSSLTTWLVYTPEDPVFQAVWAFSIAITTGWLIIEYVEEILGE